MIPLATVTLTQVSDAVSLFALIGTGLIVTAFVILYASRSRWRSTAAGRALLISKVSLAAIVWWSVIANLVSDPNWDGREIIRPLLFLAIMIAQIMLLAALIKAQNQDPHDIHVR